MLYSDAERRLLTTILLRFTFVTKNQCLDELQQTPGSLLPSVVMIVFWHGGALL
jgi:hypothetical protein